MITGPFVLLYVPGKLFVNGNASATADNILAHQSLFQAYIVVGFLSELAFIAVVLALYQLFKGVNRELAIVMVILVLITAPLSFLSIGNEVATLSLLRSTDFLSGFDKPQHDALATLLINFDQLSIPASIVFWGLWLLPLAMLVYRSGFIPRFIGVWLFINGLTYVALSAIGILAPQNYDTVRNVATPILFGEVALMLWLLIVGARERSSSAVAAYQT